MIFRINLRLNLIVLFKSIITKLSTIQTKQLKQFFLKKTNKKFCNYTSYGRVGFVFLLDYFKIKFPKKNHIVVPSYYLPEMINIAYVKKFNISFCDVRFETFEIDLLHIKNLINDNTVAVILPNIFRSYKKQDEIYKFLKKKKIFSIEDCAISFDNFIIKKKKKIYLGQKSNFCIYSFNIMKEVSCFYGGAILHNDKNFDDFLFKLNKSLSYFSNLVLLKQIVIYFILKILTIRIIFILLTPLFKKIYKNRIIFFLKMIYPSLNFKKSTSLQKNYYTKPHFLFLRLLYLQIKDRKLDDFISRKKLTFIIIKN